MKKLAVFLISLLCVITCAIGFTACGGNDNKDNLIYSEYQYKENGEIIAEGYSVKAANTDISGDIVIPATYNGKAVIVISEYGFEGCNNITTLRVPEGVIFIGHNTFSKNTVVNLPYSLRKCYISGGKEFNYNGTNADWLNIKMGVLPATTVHLTDGDRINNQFTPKN